MSGIGVQNPLGALGLTAAIILVVLYLRDRRRRTVAVGSLFLWRQLPARAVARRRFRPDALFLLQLGLVLALVAGLLRPYLEGGALPAPPGALLLVVDVSASMQARERAGTRFDLARRRAAELVAELGPRDEVMVVVAAERPHVALRWTGDHARVRTRLETLAALDVPGMLAPAVELALASVRARPGARVAVLTDLPPAGTRLDPGEVARVDWIQVGATDDNLAISSLVVERPVFRAVGEATATVVIRNYGRAERRAVLEASVGDRAWTRQDVVVAGGGTERVVLTEPPADGVMTAALAVDDALDADNRALAWIEPAEELDVLVVSDAAEPAASLAALAAAVPGSRIRTMPPARYAAEEPAARLAVFDRVLPPEPARVARALYVAPPPAGGPCRSTPPGAGATVVDWSAEHPALGGLVGLTALDLPGARAVRGEPWAEPVVTAVTPDGTFPVLLAGARDGQRIACLGMELDASLAASDRLPVLLLTLGVLRWLAGSDAEAVIRVETGVPVAVPGPGWSHGRHPKGLRVVDDPPTVVAERVGTHRVDGRVILANLFDDRESDIGRTGALESRATRRDAPGAGSARREIGWWLYLLAAALLAVEWIVWMRRADA